jgi:inhibitor of KinA sporulation pathway (predicted exonuclease)
MVGILNKLKLPLDGRHHSGLDDAKNIAKILIKLMQAQPQPRHNGGGMNYVGNSEFHT